MAGVSPEAARALVLRHRRLPNRLESHLGCVACRGPLTDGVCPTCDPGDALAALAPAPPTEPTP